MDELRSILCSSLYLFLQTIMLNDKIENLNTLQYVLRKADKFLSTLEPEAPYSEFEAKFQEIGLERGWGDTAEHVSKMINYLLDLLNAPDPSTLETFLSMVPMIFNVVIMSPHGYFAQDNVLGYPDTGGQVILLPRNYLRNVHCLSNMMHLSDCLHLGSSSWFGN